MPHWIERIARALGLVKPPPPAPRKAVGVPTLGAYPMKPKRRRPRKGLR